MILVTHCMQYWLRHCILTTKMEQYSMLTRRTFLQSSILSLTIPAGNCWSASALHPFLMPVRVIVATACSDSRRFMNSLPVLSAAVDCYEGENLHTIASAIDHCDCTALAGLTRQSEFILLSQIAYEHGFESVYTGTHLYRQTGLQHDLHGDKNLIGKLASLLEKEKQALSWSGNLARCIPEIIQSTGLTAESAIHSPVNRPADSPGYLVSWAFRKV